MDWKKRKQQRGSRQLTVLAAIVFAMIVIIVIGLIFVRRYIEKEFLKDSGPYQEYKKHYAFISESYEDNFWKTFYNCAVQYGKEQGDYIEWMGNGLSIEYSKAELLEIAIAAKVDGMIVEGDSGRKTKELIDEADAKGIPAVTVMTDSYGSARKCFVGLGSYDLGREYARQIIRLATKETDSVLLLVDAEPKAGAQDIIYSGIIETLANEGNHLDLKLDTLAVGIGSPFSEEETIREVLGGRAQIPKIMICLNEKNTISAYQAAVDYHLAGKVNILGYSAANVILDAISRNIVAATVVVDAEQMGVQSIKALDEYKTAGYVDDFVRMDVYTVTAKNVKEYMPDVDEMGEE